MTIVDLIEAHRAAVMADQANFTDDGKAINAVAAAISSAALMDAVVALADAPCRDSADVQAKISYLLNGAVGFGDRYQLDANVARLLRSLVAPDSVRLADARPAGAGSPA